MIDFVYILDIVILFIVLGYRGKTNGILPESFFCVATILAGYAAFINQFWISPFISSIIPTIDDGIVKFVIFALLYTGIRMGLATVGLQMFGQLRTTPFPPQVHLIGGVGFALIKSLFLASIVVYGLDFLSTVTPLITDPIHGNPFVEFFFSVLVNSYDAIFSTLVD